jgi:hypothetical protein
MNRIEPVRAKRSNGPRLGLFPLSSRRAIPFGFRDISSRTDGSVGRMLFPSNQASTNDLSAFQDLNIGTRDAGLGVSAHISSAPPGGTQPLPSSSEMRITARRLNRRERTTVPDTGRPHAQRGSDSDSDRTLFDHSIEQDDEPQVQVLRQGYNFGVQEPISPHLIRRSRDQNAKEQQSNTTAQRELQYITQQGEQENPFAQDILGLGMLLQAAKVIEDRERGQQIQQERNMEHDRIMHPDGSDSDGPDSQSHHSNDNEPRFQDASQTSKRNKRLPPPPPGFVLTIPGSTEAVPLPASSPQELKRRRSERVATLKPIYYRPSKRAKTEQNKSKSTSKMTPTDTSNTTAGHSTSTNPNLNRDTPAQRAIVRARIKASRDHIAALARGKSRPPKWSPLVKSYLEEQRVRQEKTRKWLEAQESSEEEGYDHGVEGGVWIESSGSEGDEDDAKGNGKEVEKGKEKGKEVEGDTALQGGDGGESPDVDVDVDEDVDMNMDTQLEIKDSQDDADDADDEHDKDNDNAHDDDDEEINKFIGQDTSSQTGNTIIVLSTATPTKNPTDSHTAADVDIDMDSDNDDAEAADTGSEHEPAQEQNRELARPAAASAVSAAPQPPRRRLVRGHRRSMSSEDEMININ